MPNSASVPEMFPDGRSARVAAVHAWRKALHLPLGVCGGARYFDNPVGSGRAHFQVSSGRPDRLLPQLLRCGCGQMQRLAPGAEAVGRLQTGRFFVFQQLAGRPAQDGSALQDFDLCLDVELGIVRAGRRHGRVDVLQVQEVLVESLNFQRGARLVHAWLGQRDQVADDATEDQQYDHRQLMAADHLPVLQQSGVVPFHAPGRGHFRSERADRWTGRPLPRPHR